MNRSREGARQALLNLRGAVAADMTNETARRILSDDLVIALLDAAWQHQFDEDRTNFKNEIQQLVSEAIERARLEEPPQ